MQKTTENKKRTVLIIEDDFINREILCSILSDVYNVLTAENGREGLDILESDEQNISLILLDIQMPVMNGYEFLEEIKHFPSLRSIPIIVTTSSATANDEIKCLENGAADFVAKPYNPDVVLRRVGSMIRLLEASSVINRVEYDSVTGLYSRDFFFMNAENLLHDDTLTDYDIFCCDIISFKLLKDRYGKPKAEKMLVTLSEMLKAAFPDVSVCGNLSEDTFAVLTPHKEHSAYESVAETLRGAVKASAIPDAEIHMAFYPCVPHSAAAVLCNNAHAAIEDISYQYGKQIAEYNEEFKSKHIRRQAILGYMESAIKEKQFEVYYQPKHLLSEDRTGGAEALVRWTHPQLGFISPGEFIPLFESCGFITELDFYIADRICSDLKGWLTEGKPVIPISWNLSRADFSHPRLVETIVETVDRYGIPHNLLHIEVTESAYTDNMAAFFDTTDRLHKLGFSIELDDFGAGYSSLTVLSELNVDILKLDMYFARNMSEKKQRLILEHIFSIAEKLNMSVVAEGVETKEQSDEFKKMGCTYIQGYYYSKPLTKAQFEEYIAK